MVLKSRIANLKSEICGSIVFQIAGLTLFFWLYHRLAVYVMTDLEIKLGAIGPQAAPLYAKLQMDLSLWVVPALATLVSYIIIFRSFLERRKLPAYILLPTFIVLVVLIDMTVAMIDGGLKAVEEPYTRSGLEYYADVPKVEGVRVFLRDYVRIFDSLSGHSRTHPPGGALFLWFVSRVVGRGLLRAAFSTILFTSLNVIPVYFLARGLYGEKTARYSLGLLLVMPNMVMFTATSMDGPFSFFPILSVYLFFRALSSRTLLFSGLTGVALGFGMLMNYTTFVTGAFFVIVTMITFFVKREKFRTTLVALLVAGGTFALFYLFLYLWARYNFFSALWAAYGKDAGSMGTGYESPGRYFHVSMANLFAFLIGAGIPLTMVWLREIWSELGRMARFGTVDIYVLACFSTLLGVSFSTLFTLEVERIWIFMAPFIVVPAAKRLCKRHLRWEFYAVAGLMCVQILLSEVFLYTHW